MDLTTTEQRAHAVLSASGYKKWSTCTMSAAVEEKFEEEDSEWSREGTFAHALGEARLAVWLGYNVLAAEQELIESEEGQEFYTDELSDYVDVYVKFVIDAVTSMREAHGEANVVVLLEQRLDFSRWVPEGFGTGDCVIVYPGGVWVIDLKFGAGVKVTDSGQLRLYGLGALDRYDLLYDVQELTTTIVQPRMDNILTETTGREELLHWADELVVPRARIAWAAYKGDRSEARFSPGEHCHKGFCRARFTCAARARAQLEATELPYAKDAPDVLTVEQLEGVVDKARPAIKWLSDVERYLTEQAVAGKVELKNHVLGKGRSNRVIIDETAAAQKLMENGFPADEIYARPKLRGLVALETLVGKTKFAEILGGLIEKPDGELRLKPKLVDPPPKKADHRKAAADFDEFED